MPSMVSSQWRLYVSSSDGPFSEKAQAILKAKIKPKLKKALDQETSKAKTAKMAAGKQYNAPKVDLEQEPWAAPSLFARCRVLAGGPLPATVLLYRIRYLWIKREKKLQRFGKDWLAMTQAQWASSSGLKRSEIADYAVPHLKNCCAEYLTIRAMGNGADKKTWVSLDLGTLDSYLLGDQAMPSDMLTAELMEQGIYSKPPPQNWYAKKPE